VAERSFQNVLATYAADLTAEARAGQLPPTYGRDGEVQELIA